MKILFYSPMQYIWQHSIPFSTLAHHFKSNNHDVYSISCSSDFSTCPALDMCRSTVSMNEKEKDPICSTCIKYDDAFFPTSHFSKINLATLLDISQFENAINLLDKTPDKTNFTLDNFPLGRYALYDTILYFKKKNITLDTDDETIYFTETIKSVIKSFLAIRKLLDLHSFDRVVIYSPQYSINRPVAELFESKNIPVYFIEAGVNISNRLDTIRIWKWRDHYLVNPALKFKYDDLGKTYLEKVQGEHILNHFKELRLGKSHMVYSGKPKKSFDFYKTTNAPTSSNIYLLAMSSFDEAFSAFHSGLFPESKACSSVYPEPIEWVKDTIKFATENPDIFLIVRLHPRDFPNKRDGIISSQGKMLEVCFQTIPKNVFICYPSLNISLYNLLPFVDTLITGWSVTALEAGILGKTVVVYDELPPSFPLKATLHGRSKEEYLANLKNAKKLKNDITNTISAINWLHLNGVIGSPSILNFFNSIAASSSFFFKVYRKLLTKYFPRLLFQSLLLFTRNQKGLDSIMRIIIENESSLFQNLELKNISDNSKENIDYFKEIKNSLDKMFPKNN